MKIVFMGTPEFAVPTLEMLIHSEHVVEAVITQPDRPKGRGKKITSSPIKEMALKYNIPVMQPIKVREKNFVNKLKDINPDIIIVIAFGQILSKEILDIPRFGCINVHASLLPKYRGAAPIQWAIINGESKTGITTMYMDEGLDTGDIILKEEIDIEQEDTAGSLHDKLSVLGAEVMRKTIELVEKGEVPREKQNNDKASYVSMLQKKNGLIDWNKKAEDICNLIRGLNPWPSAYTYLDGKILKIWDAYIYESPVYYDGKNGEVVDIYDGDLVVKTGDELILITQVQLQGRKRMPVKEFLKGYKIKKHTLFGINI